MFGMQRSITQKKMQQSDIDFTESDIKHWKHMLIDNYFNKEALNKEIWAGLKDLKTALELVKFELYIGGLIKEKAENKSIGQIYTEAKSTMILRKMGIKVKEFAGRIPTDFELQEIEDDLDKWLDNTEYDSYTSSDKIFREFTDIDEDDIV